MGRLYSVKFIVSSLCNLLLIDKKIDLKKKNVIVNVEVNRK